MTGSMGSNDVIEKTDYVIEELHENDPDIWTTMTKVALECGDAWSSYNIHTLPLSMAERIAARYQLSSPTPVEMALAYALRVSPIVIEGFLEEEEIDLTKEITAGREPPGGCPIYALAELSLPAVFIDLGGALGRGIGGIAVVPDKTDHKLLLGVEVAGALMPCVINFDELIARELDCTVENLLTCTEGAVSRELAIQVLVVVMGLGMTVQDASGLIRNMANDAIWGSLLAC